MGRRRHPRKTGGGLYIRGGLWWIRYRRRGRQVRESSGSTDRRLAEALLRRRLDELGADRLGVRPFVGRTEERLTVAEMLDAALAAYLVTRNLDPAQAPRSMLSHMKPLREAFGRLRAVEITEEMIDRYIAARRNARRKPATINRELEILRRAFNLAVARKRLASMPLVPRLKENNVRRGFFEDHAFEAVVERLPGYLKDFARFAFITGWRKGEIASLTWADVDREGGVVRLRPEASKNGHGRLVPIEEDLVPLIERRWSARAIETPEGGRLVPYVFHREGHPIGFIRRAWRRACEEAGLPGRLFHDLRRTAVRNMLRSGTSEKTAMDISGHRTQAVFYRYNISSEKDLREAIQRTCRRRCAAERPAAVANLGRGNLGQPRGFAARRVPRSHTPDDDETIG